MSPLSPRLLPLLALLIGPPAAAAVEDHPAAAPIDLSACAPCARPDGVVQVPVPIGLRHPAEDARGADLLLLGPGGARVPFAAVLGHLPDQRVLVRVRPDAELDRWLLDPPPYPLDALQLELRDAHAIAANVRAFDPVTGQLRAEDFLWWWGPVAHDRLRLNHLREPLRIEVQWHGRRPDAPPDFTGWRALGPVVPDETVPLALGPTVLGEDGMARTTLTLPRGLPVSHIEVLAEGELFERRALVRTPDHPLRGTTVLGEGTLRRVMIGEARVDDTKLALSTPSAADRWVLEVDASADPPLVITAVNAIVPGRALWLRGPGPGPLTLYGGGPAAEPVSDLRVALSELVEGQESIVLAGEAGPNPAFVPPEQAAQLAGPGAPLDGEGRLPWAAPVSGPAGLVRLPLPVDVLSRARPDLGDLRLVVESSDGPPAQVPFLLRRATVDHAHGELPVEREERGRVSRLTVTLPDAAVPTSTLTLRSSAPLFQRRVTVLQDRGDHVAHLRAADWRAADRPGALSFDLGDAVGDRLVIEIDNGDDPPLPIDGVSATYPAWELIAALPDGGATLRFGDKHRRPPEYDLSLLSPELEGRAEALATLGPLEERAPPPLAVLDKAALFAGIAALVAGLVLLTARLLRAVPEALPAAEPDSGAAEPG